MYKVKVRCIRICLSSRTGPEGGRLNVTTATNTPYFAFHPELYHSHVTSTNNKARYIRPSNHVNRKEQAFPYSDISNGQEAFKSLAIVRTTSQPSYFFGDHLGMLTWKSSNRRFETIEASIKFVEEDEEEDKYTEEDKEQGKEQTQKWKQNIPGNYGIYII